MKLFHSGLVAIGCGVLLIALFVATQTSADDPGQEPQKAAPPVAAPFSSQLSAIQKRRSEADGFIRDFELPSIGIDVERELKITNEQSEKLVVILNRIRRDPNTARRFPSFPPVGQDEALAKRALEEAEAAAAALERAKNEITAVLSAEQLQRMQQIQFQNRLRNSGMSDTLGRESIAKSLNLKPNQLLQMRDLEKLAQEQFLKELADLREQQRQRLVEARKKVLSVLTPEQLTEYEKLVGPPLEIDDRQLEYGVAGVMSRMSFGRSRGVGGFGGRPLAEPARPAEAKPPDEKK